MSGKFFQKVAEDDPNHGRIPPGQYLTKGFPVLTYGSTPHLTLDRWQLRVWGEIEGGERVLSWDDLMALPPQTFTADFHCVTRWSKLDVTWTGVAITDLLSSIPLTSKAKAVMQHCEGGYTTNLLLDEFIRPDNYLVYQLAGDPIPPDHGGPVRSLVPHLYAWKSAKWLTGLEVLSTDQPGFWERNGYHMRGEPWAEERYSSGY
ncbi:MAG: sulfite oxidase-like oxidoreductase [Cyanobacteriota bacterium]|nr:sulfite oxidase-like oxidoreductase [Cyanobacteriota bacterium]